LITDGASGDGKLVSASRVTLSQLMLPEHANIRGDVHGGWIMKLVDEAGALAAMRHAQSRVVTVAIDQMQFHEPISIGDLVTFNAEISYTGRTSMEARVQVIAENPISGQRTHTNTAYVVYVALDEKRNPRTVPTLIPENEVEERRLKAGAQRQAYRLSQRAENRQEALH
jgi:acyl-CoA hydrolase